MSDSIPSSRRPAMDTGTRPDHSQLFVCLGAGREMLLAVSVARTLPGGGHEHDAPTVEEIQEAGQSLQLLAFHTRSSL